MKTLGVIPGLILLAGCAHHSIEPYGLMPRPLPAPLRAHLGTISVISTNTALVFEFRGPNSRSRALTSGMAHGLSGGVVTVKGGFDALNGANLGEAGIFVAGAVLAVGATVATVGAVAGAATGFSTGVSATKARKIQTTLTKVVAESNLQKDLRHRVVKLLREKSHPKLVLAEPALESLPSSARVAQGAAERIDTLLEIQIERIHLAALTRSHSPLLLDVSATVRLVRVRDGVVIYKGSLEYGSRSRRLMDWSMENGRLFRAELAGCSQALAEKVVGEIFQYSL